MTTATKVKTAIKEVVAGNNLDYQLSEDIMKAIMGGEVSDVEIATLLTALRLKGESIDEISAFADVMRAFATQVEHPTDSLDIVGTGGDGANTFNISTTSSFVIAAAGIPVTKHGNRSASSKSGSADCMEQLGIQLDLSADEAEEVLEKTGMTFLFSQKYHPAMRYVAELRRQMGIRTVFNILGPLANPANCNYQMLGVYDSALIEPLIQVLKKLGLKRAMVFSGDDGLDEITLTTTSHVATLRDGEINYFVFNPKDYGFDYCQLEDLVGGEPPENAQITREILQGTRQDAKSDTVLLNAGLAIALVKDGYSLGDGIEEARQLIQTGAAAKKLEEVIQASQTV
ncbi:anthranilate phosphoribosyltransferase [Aerococcus sanguinicola]